MSEHIDDGGPAFPVPGNDTRLGLPSASQMYRLENCPASFLLGKQAQEQGLVPPAGNEADSGTRIHRWLETGDHDDWMVLDDAEKDIAIACEQQATDIVSQWHTDETYRMFVMESRLAMMTDGAVQDMPDAPDGVDFTGQADMIVVEQCTRRGLVLDYKTGRGEVTPAKGNSQLRALAVLAARRWRLTSVRVAIVQPLCGAPSLADYGESELDAAGQLVGNTICIVQDAGNEPNAGDWCRYCQARAICPALKSEALAVSTAPSRAAMIDIATSAPAGDLGRMLDARERIGWWMEAVESAAKARLQAGDEIPGWTLKPRAGKRVIEDTEKAAAAVAGLLEFAEGGPSAALLRSATLSAASLTAEIRKAGGMNGKRYNLTEKDAKQALADALGGLMTQGTTMVLAKAVELEGGAE